MAFKAKPRTVRFRISGTTYVGRVLTGWNGIDGGALVASRTVPAAVAKRSTRGKVSWTHPVTGRKVSTTGHVQVREVSARA